eukprot:3395110-Alexandrium_andersonii.AAC.1
MLGGSSGVARDDRNSSELPSSGTPPRPITSSPPLAKMGLGRVLGDIGTPCASLILGRSALAWCWPSHGPQKSLR